MSQVLVAHPNVPPSAMSLVEEEGVYKQLELSKWADKELVADRRLAFQLAHLASQHHTSEYNQLKFGPQGCPTKYIPWSILSPGHAQHEKMLYAQNAVKNQAWWPANSGVPFSTRPAVENPATHNQSQPLSPVPPEQGYTQRLSNISDSISDCQDLSIQSDKPVPPLNYPPALDLQRELSVAMDSPLSIISTPQLSSRIHLQQSEPLFEAKTSETHPINISSIVPCELLPLITSHLDPRPSHSAYLFSLIPSLLLHHIVSPRRPSDIHRTYPLMRMGNDDIMNGNGVYASPPYSFPLHEAPKPPFTGTLDCLPVISGDSQRSTLHFSSDPHRDSVCPAVADSAPPLDMAASLHTISMPPLQNRPQSAPPSIPSTQPLVPNVITNGIGLSPPRLSEMFYAISADIISTSFRSNIEHRRKGFSDIQRDTLSNTEASDSIPALRFAQSPRLPTLGNIFLSSCPGKKVRLNGPVKGRGAICRDLGHDLRRIRSLGVRCIICCLDDQELDFLGASWSNYHEIAKSLGIDVLRIPMPEGFAPASPKQLDEHLSYIINTYTVQGIPVLVHCRGGVGRAGLVACCWMLKLGLCGWVDPNDDTIPGHASENQEYCMVRRSTVVLVEKAISVVRRRRSVKAIETFEQVRFLVEFVEYMRALDAFL